MSEIEIPSKPDDTIESVSQLLDQIESWHARNAVEPADAHRAVWYRGHGNSGYLLQPGIFRSPFTLAAVKMPSKSVEEQRLRLEREILSQFRTAGAALLDPADVIQTYFLAQHHGMPTRLLDWTTNPLAALFFASSNRDSKVDGDVLLMDARKLLPKPPSPIPPDFPRDIITARHPYTIDAIGESFWVKPREPRRSLILPVRPDSRSGRIVHQSSCFTLHMHNSSSCNNPTMGRFRVPGGAKEDILAELRRLNINPFSIFGDLDHLSSEIRMARGIP